MPPPKWGKQALEMELRSPDTYSGFVVVVSRFCLKSPSHQDKGNAGLCPSGAPMRVHRLPEAKPASIPGLFYGYLCP